MNPQHLLSLQIDNFKRIETLWMEFNPEGGVFQVMGANDQGKSSACDALAAAIGGKDYKPEKPVRIGAEFAEVIAQTQDLTITARWTEKSHKIVVENKDGSRHRSPQAVLDSFYSSFTIDPEEFTRIPDKEKAAALRKMLGIDVAELDGERARLFAERTAVSREHKIFAGQLAALKLVKPPAGEIEAEVSVAALANEQAAAMRTNAANEKARSLFNSALVNVESFGVQVVEKEKSIAELYKKLEEEKVALNDLRERARRHLEATSKLEQDAKALQDIDTSKIDEAIAQAAAKNRNRQNMLFQLAEHRRSKATLENAQKLATEKEAEANRLTEAMKEIDEKKRKLLADAKLPLEGMTIEEDSVYVGGVPFSQISSSEQIRVGLAVALSMKPTLRVILIKHGDLIYDQKLAVIQQWALENKVLVITERHETEGAVGVVLVDGKAKGEPNGD